MTSFISHLDAYSTIIISLTRLIFDFIIQLHFVEYEYKYHAVFCTTQDLLDRFPVVDQSVSWISHANSVPPRILLSRIPRKLISAKFARKGLHGQNNLACWIINLLLDILLCSIAYGLIKIRHNS